MVANNADDYANSRQNIFFPANNNTPQDGNLTGQCVTLVKWFTAEMCNNFPDPFAARGDARYVGQNLVAQELADEVPYDQRKRGDIICLEYGTYGHIYVQLSGGRVFEENVNLGGVASRVVDGETVYASRIGSDSESWRAARNPHAYRLKSYNEGGNTDMATDAQIDDWISKQHYIAFGQPADKAVFDQWRPVLKNNFAEGSLSILTGLDSNTDTLKYKAQHAQPSGEYVPYTPPQLFTKKS
jgi:hypothetical protein